MGTTPRSIAARTGALLAAAALLAACGSSSVSESKLESKLKSEPSIKTLEQNSGQSATVDKVVQCIAQDLKKNADQGDLKKYVDGKKNLADIGGKKKGSAQAATDYAKACASNVVKSGTATATNTG